MIRNLLRLLALGTLIGLAVAGLGIGVAVAIARPW